MGQDDIEHTEDCELDDGVCTCHFDKRMREAARAKDFVKCTNPDCPVLEDWAEANAARLSLGFPVRSTKHCHPIF